MVPVILIVEDDREMQKYLKDLLNESGFNVKTASDGITALSTAGRAEPDLVLLDLSLPDMNGEGVFLEIRKKYPTVPVIMLTAKDTVTDKIKGLNLGADDYITKPFIPEELIARIKARLRTREDTNQILKIADLELDTRTYQVKRNSQEISLTPQEFKLLHYLINNKGTVLTRDMILNRIWLNSPDVETRVVDVYIGYLRKKIDSGSKQKLIHSVRGFGYMIKG
jgi:DNA-binding response OmpR family regulator